MSTHPHHYCYLFSIKKCTGEGGCEVRERGCEVRGGGCEVRGEGVQIIDRALMITAWFMGMVGQEQAERT